MSYVFGAGNTTVWSPSLRVGRTYAGFAACLADLLQCPVGLIAIADDMVELDLPVFTAFIENLLASYLSSQNVVHRDQLRPVLAPSIVMLDRSGHAVEARTPEEQETLSELRAVSARMPA